MNLFSPKKRSPGRNRIVRLLPLLAVIADCNLAAQAPMALAAEVCRPRFYSLENRFLNQDLPTIGYQPLLLHFRACPKCPPQVEDTISASTVVSVSASSQSQPHAPGDATPPVHLPPPPPSSSPPPACLLPIGWHYCGAPTTRARRHGIVSCCPAPLL
jgi:hypothetical protein